MQSSETSIQGAPMKLRYYAEYWALVGLSLLVRAMPRRAALALGAGLGRLGWSSGLRRRLVLANLEQALPGLDARARRRVAARAAASFGQTGVEFLRFAGRDRNRVADLVEIEGLDGLRAALERGRGAILVSAHLGSWALYVTALAACGIPSALLVGRQHNPKVDRLILGIPGDAVRFISKGPSSPRGVIKALRGGSAVVIVADQRARRGPMVPFLGRAAHTLALPAAIVERHDAPLFLFTGRRLAGGKHHVQLEPLSVPSPGDAARAPDAEARRLAIASAINEGLGRAILRHPDQYFWYHDRWRRYAPGPCPDGDEVEEPLGITKAEESPDPVLFTSGE